MSSIDEHFTQAERLRISGSSDHHFYAAIAHLLVYLLLGGSKEVEAHQMMGVCFQRLHRYDEATECYVHAIEAASDYQRGNIERDLAESYGGLGEYALAEISLATSLDLLPYELYPVEHATSLGFLARLQQRQGQLSEAVETFADADEKLHAGNNPHVELYNKLAYSSALSQAGQQLKSRHVAINALRLSLGKKPSNGPSVWQPTASPTSLRASLRRSSSGRLPQGETGQITDSHFAPDGACNIAPVGGLVICKK
ncbi:tetratricopeptide repeat protein [Candidatus Saccharibacteria bacterium]|nr:tetratricopeptide repeat protein [Candidatus Saccharibacteria bacterium]